jgi:tetratricopeptide (TPR) repeat protein
MQQNPPPQPSQGQQFMPLAEALVLAERYRGEGRALEAEGLCRKVLEAQPNLPEAVHLLGVIAHQNGKVGEAIEHVRRATQIAPQVALYHANLGEMLRLTGKPKQAAEEARRALEIEPAMAAALSNLGVALYELKDYEGSAQAHRKAVAAKPDFAQAHSNLGNALHALKRFDEAVVSYRRAIELAPNFADGWSNLGTTLHHSGRYDEAIAALRRAIALDPNQANAHSGLGILLLMRGDMAEGWEEYEWRLKSTEVRLPYHPQRPWQGESLKGRRIYIHAEQGFGDTIQFTRYVPLLAARGAAVTFRVQQGLAGLFRQSLPGIEVLGDRGAPAVIADCECALLSLPRLFGTRLETIPAIVPYLRADEKEAAQWRARFAKLGGFKVGIVWAGNPEHVNDMRRSIPLDDLASVFAVPGVSFVSLQVGPRASELEKRRDLKIADVSSDLVGFAQTAAAMEALDLVITIDSSVAHLAGALAKPTWLFMPWVSDWRWLLGREDNPWYPSMRLFRQLEGQSWREIAARVASELAKAAQGDQTALLPYRAAGEKRARHAADTIAALESRVMSPPPAPTLSPPQVLALAEQRRQAGKLAEAEMLARRVLDAEPGNAEAFHLLGIVAHQSGNLAHAIEHVKRATQLAPGVALYHANLGEMCRLAKRTDEAIAEGERALAIQPDYADALSNVGIAYFEKDDFDAAIRSYERAIALKPGFAEAHSNLGNALRGLKRYDEALPHYRRSIELKPQFADAWNNLGTTLRDLKRNEEAEDAYNKALTLKPDDPDTLNNLALALKDLNRLDEAEATLRRSLAIESRNEKTLLYLGTVLLDRHKPDEAAAALEQALALNTVNHDVHNMLGRVAFERNDLDGALRHHRRALELKPDLADALNNMGNVLKELGKLDEARECYIKALALDPSVTGVYVNYADSVKFTPDNPHLKTMQAMRDGAVPLADTDRLQLDYALAKSYADLKEHKRSFAHLLSGSKLKRAQIQYDEPAALALFDRIEAVFTPELIRSKAKLGGGEASSVPIFVLGMPRSGTTLVEQILASHPQVHGAGELKAFNDVVNEVHGPDGQTIPYPEFMPALDAAALGKIGARYLAELRKLAPQAPHITDKMPSNYYFAGLIHLALPNAKIIHTVRDPVDTCISCFSKLFTAEQNHTYDLGELGRYHRRYRQLMDHWRRLLPAGCILDVRYEDVVADLDTQARRIVSHCGLAWDDRCLSFHETDRPVRTASATQVRQPIYKSAVGRWRVYEEFLGPLLTELDGSAV